MPRPNTGPKLTLIKPKGYARPLYFIRWYEGGRRQQRATGTNDLRAAEKILADHITEQARRRRPVGPHEPSALMVSETLALYAEHHAPGTSDPARIAFAIDALLPQWRGRTVEQVTAAECRRYYITRRSELAQKFPLRAADNQHPTVIDGKTGASCFDGTIRRELGCLGAALEWCRKENHLSVAPPVWLPPKPESSRDWLTRQQVAALLRAARNEPKARLHLPLFILLGIYTGQRKEAILALQWQPNTDGGYVDLSRQRIDFNSVGRRQTKKRRPIIPIPKRLLRFLRSARTRTRQYVIEAEAFRLVDGKRQVAVGPVASIKHSFASAAIRAGLCHEIDVECDIEIRNSDQATALKRRVKKVPVADISPHYLRHTCATWLMQHGIPTRDAADYLGMDEATLKRVYYHHHPDYMQAAAKAFG